MNNAFHLKYRPETLDEVIGHKAAVTRLKGMIKGNDIPNALLLTGSTGVGKTTLSRALAHDINRKPINKQGGDYKEINGTEQRTIDEMRGLVQVSKYRPKNKKRIIVMDEFQGILSNSQAAAALLKPIEEPSADTLWILCTMDPSKLTTGNGRAIANRCSQFSLELPSEDDLRKQAIRIAKAENMKYVKPLLDDIVRKCNGEMRSLANLMQSIKQMEIGSGKSKFKSEDLQELLKSTNDSDERLVVDCISALYDGRYKAAVKALLDVQDYFRFTNMLLNANSYILYDTVLEGKKHSKLQWYLNYNKELKKKVRTSLGHIANVQSALVQAKERCATFQVDADKVLADTFFHIIKDNK